MTDARYPEAWLNDRRVVRLSDAGHRLFVTANAWAASNRTDGFLEADDLALIHGVDARHHTELVSAGLWAEVPGGWQIVDFHKTQTTKAQLEGLDHKRHQDRERKARERARKRGEPEPEPQQDEDLSRVTTGVTSDVTQRQGKDRQGKDRQQLQESLARTPEAEPRCSHGVVNGDQPDQFFTDKRVACPQCALALKRAS